MLNYRRSIDRATYLEQEKKRKEIEEMKKAKLEKEPQGQDIPVDDDQNAGAIRNAFGNFGRFFDSEDKVEEHKGKIIMIF